MEHINGIEAGEVKNDLPTEKEATADIKAETPKESPTDLSTLKFPKEGIKISGNDLKEAAFAMKQDLQKEKQKSN